MSTIPAKPVASDLVKIDAGIIFAGEDSYRCIPLSELSLDGIDSASDVRLLESSCECVQPSLVSFRKSPSQIEDALYLDFSPGPDIGGEHATARLAVQIILQPVQGAARTLVVYVLETQRINDLQ